MEKDRIYRQDAIDIIRQYDSAHIKFFGEPIPALACICSDIEDLPSAEPERKTGKWVATPNGFHYCSNCRMGADYDNYGHEVLRDFCPNCGAKMVEDDPSHPFADDVMMGERRTDE